jgi:hypothetical protein
MAAWKKEDTEPIDGARFPNLNCSYVFEGSFDFDLPLLL